MTLEFYCTALKFFVVGVQFNLTPLIMGSNQMAELGWYFLTREFMGYTAGPGICQCMQGQVIIAGRVKRSPEMG